MFDRAALLLPLALLAACNGRDEAGAKQQTSLKIDTPGFKADVSMPFLNRISDEMEVGGVKLYPGTTIAGVEVNARDTRNDRVTMRFSAPADQAKVTTWFQQQFTNNGFQTRRTPTGFSGNTNDGDWFTLDLKAGGAATEGEFKLGKSQG